MAQKTVLAVDLGAESGRVTAVHFDDNTLRVEELHRFPNETVTVNGTLHWDFLRLWGEIQAGIAKGKVLQPASIGVDTWGVDFGLLDKQDNLIGSPVHYRDSRTTGMMERALAVVPQAEIFAQTGIQFMPINTLYQMLSLVENQSPQLQIASTFLTAPDLLNFWLTGAKVCEFSNATTTQMVDAGNGRWATNLLTKLDIPTHIFPEIVQPGTNLGLYEGIPIIAPACHDTGSAVAAVPALSDDFAYISSGTWSLVGLEVDEPILTSAALVANVTNEGGVYGTYRLLKNVMGLWILQQCRATWAAAGEAYSYAELVALAEEAEPLVSIFNPNDPAFFTPGDHPQHIREMCQQTGQPAPQTPGEMTRCVLESLALAYREVLAQVTDVADRTVSTIHIVGGGSQNDLLNQMTADAIGLPVVAGPVEATVIGNALVQLITLGEMADWQQARQVVAGMGELKRYEPARTAVWDDAYGRYQQLIREGKKV
ncbi:rhamnulokinase [Candidatus Leptofilum sp.]|uniref:rhamnulokinase n=1 Tax=Candidatus Leptofilum sp. TaxID=3241576 RepID=UPI003B59FD2D